MSDTQPVSPPGSSVRGISQARIQEWVAIFYQHFLTLILSPQVALVPVTKLFPVEQDEGSRAEMSCEAIQRLSANTPLVSTRTARCKVSTGLITGKTAGSASLAHGRMAEYLLSFGE